MSTSSAEQQTDQPVWTPDLLSAFMVKMQLRLVAIIRAKPGAPDQFPEDPFYTDNLRGEMIFAFNVIGHAVLSGIDPPPTYTYLLRRLSRAFENQIPEHWQALLRTTDKMLWLHEHEDVPDDLPFPRWWEDDPVRDCDLSTWIVANLAKSSGNIRPKLQSEVETLLAQLWDLEQSVEDQMGHTHEYLAASAEDLQSSSREWASIHSSVRSQAGMAVMDLPLTMQFK